jgi:RimJ/RimL family protein N-acetyltransferase
MTNGVALRYVIESDLPIFFVQQLDPDAVRMAAFLSRDRVAFMAHWAKILADATIIKKTILFDGEVAGNIVSFEQSGDTQVGYWLGQNYWGKGIATRALTVFLDQVNVRPIYAYVAKQNIASRRVLEKCGFTICGEKSASFSADGEADMEYLLKLEATGIFGP